jgi:hypothetical protein
MTERVGKDTIVLLSSSLVSRVPLDLKDVVRDSIIFHYILRLTLLYISLYIALQILPNPGARTLRLHPEVLTKN